MSVGTPDESPITAFPEPPADSGTLEWHCLHHADHARCSRDCLLRDTLALFGKKNMLSVIRWLLLHGTLRFNELHERVGGSPKTLTARLRDLEARGLVAREVFDEIPLRVEYSLTAPGSQLQGLFEYLSRWAGRWLEPVARSCTTSTGHEIETGSETGKGE